MTHDLDNALHGVRQVIVDALRQMEGGAERDAIVELIQRRVPSDGAGWWWLAARILMDRAVGIVEAWLDSPGLEAPIADVLRDNLTVLVSEGIGEELTPDGLVALADEASRRPIHWFEMVTPLLFVIETVDMAEDPDVEAMILLA